MTAPTSLEKQRRRRYDHPARLSPTETAGEIRQLTRASLRLVEQLQPSKLGRGVPRLELRAEFEAVVTDIDALRMRLNSVLRAADLAGAARPVREPRVRTTGQAAPTQDGGIVAQLANRGELIESTAFAQRMGWTRQALSKALGANRVFYVEHGGVRLYPAFFAEPTYERARLEQVSKVLGTLPGGAKLQFFLSGRGSLGGTSVLEAMAKGRVSQVLAAAEAYVQG